MNENQKRRLFVFDVEWTYTRHEPAPAWLQGYRLQVYESDDISEAFDRLRLRVSSHMADKMLDATIDANEYIRETLRINRAELGEDTYGRYEFGSVLVLTVQERVI